QYENLCSISLHRSDSVAGRGPRHASISFMANGKIFLQHLVVVSGAADSAFKFHPRSVFVSTPGVTTPNSISASVGDQGANVRGDVVAVQTLLDAQGFDPGGVDGNCGPQTIAAIRRFQHTFMVNPDGLIEPGKATWMRLRGGDALPSSPAAP